MKKIIVAREKATGIRYKYCVNSGVCWFATGGLCVAAFPLLKAEQRIKELKVQELVRLFRKIEGQSEECITVNLKNYDLFLEDAEPWH